MKPDKTYRPSKGKMTKKGRKNFYRICKDLKLFESFWGVSLLIDKMNGNKQLKKPSKALIEKLPSRKMYKYIYWMIFQSELLTVELYNTTLDKYIARG